MGGSKKRAPPCSAIDGVGRPSANGKNDVNDDKPVVVVSAALYERLQQEGMLSPDIEWVIQERIAAQASLQIH